MRDDHVKHGVAGLALGLVMSFLGWWGLALIWLVVIGFEVYQDASGTGLAEWSDVFVGGFAATGVWMAAFIVKAKSAKG